MILQPKISLGIDPPEEDPETEIGDERIENDVREEQSEKVSDEEADLDWSKEDNIKAVDALIGFTHDLAAESSPPEVRFLFSRDTSRSYSVDISYDLHAPHVIPSYCLCFPKHCNVIPLY